MNYKGSAKFKDPNLGYVVNQTPDFLSRVEVQYTPLEQFRINRITRERKELESTNYYSELAQNAVEEAHKTDNQYLKNLLLERSRDYKKIAKIRKDRTKAYLSIDAGTSLTYREVPYYKRLRANVRKLIESIARKASDEIHTRAITTDPCMAKSKRNEIGRAIYNLVLLSLLLQICVGDRFVTILPPNYYNN